MPGHKKTIPSEYTAWSSIKSRCYNPRAGNYFRYGARGIGVCDRWRHSFANFMADMGPKPTPKHSIDRYPNKNGDYEPGNCRWATQTEQNRNQLRNRMVTVAGITKTSAEWCDEYRINKQTLSERLKRGWSHERAVTAPLTDMAEYCRQRNYEKGHL